MISSELVSIVAAINTILIGGFTNTSWPTGPLWVGNSCHRDGTQGGKVWRYYITVGRKAGLAKLTGATAFWINEQIDYIVLVGISIDNNKLSQCTV